MKGQGKIKYWFTKNGVHVPVYEKYTTRKGVEPENPKAKFKKGTKKESFNTEESIRKTPEKKEFKLKNEVWHEDKEGWSVGLTSAGDIYVGRGQLDSRFYKDTPENRERAIAEWKANSFAKEKTKPQSNSNDLRKSIEKDIKSKMETHWKWAGEDKDRFATTDTKSVMTRVDTMLDHFKGKDIITPGEDSEVPGEIKWKFTGRNKTTGKRASFDFSEAPNPEKAKESLRKNGYQVSSYNIYPEQIYNYLFNHTNVDDYDKMAAQALSKQALSDWRKKHKEK